MDRRGFMIAGFCAVAAPAIAAPVPAVDGADRIRVLKSKRVLQLLAGTAVVKSYPCALGRHPSGPKRQLGDGRTPEGFYILDWRTARSAYHRALHISYPNSMDLARARAAHVNPGGGIFLHGMPVRYGPFDPVFFFVDWTDGCIAVGNIAIEEIWNDVPDGTVVEILA